MHIHHALLLRRINDTDIFVPTSAVGVPDGGETGGVPPPSPPPRPGLPPGHEIPGGDPPGRGGPGGDPPGPARPTPGIPGPGGESVRTLLGHRGRSHEPRPVRPPYQSHPAIAGRYWGGSAHSPDPTAQSAPACARAPRRLGHQAPHAQGYRPPIHTTYV